MRPANRCSRDAPAIRTPSILTEYVDGYFGGAMVAPFMKKVFGVGSDRRAEIPAVLRADGTSRQQTVSQEQGPFFWLFIDEFGCQTGLPVVLSTSFNLRGEPIVCSLEDILRAFFSSGLDALVLGEYLVDKTHSADGSADRTEGL